MNFKALATLALIAPTLVFAHDLEGLPSSLDRSRPVAIVDAPLREQPVVLVEDPLTARVASLSRRGSLAVGLKVGGFTTLGVGSTAFFLTWIASSLRGLGCWSDCNTGSSSGWDAALWTSGSVALTGLVVGLAGVLVQRSVSAELPTALRELREREGLTAKAESSPLAAPSARLLPAFEVPPQL